ncbi:MAG: hypothetical protein E7582_03775 [Ruminococcaceae bacterium]|nr:hypothetical protein [Oscillospiraceae bacterium]
MDDVINNKITEILNSPDLMDNVRNILGQLGEKEKAEDIIVEETPSISSILDTLGDSNLLSSLGSLLGQNKNERIALLTALLPFLSKEKQDSLSLIIKVLKAISIFNAANILS